MCLPAHKEIRLEPVESSPTNHGNPCIAARENQSARALLIAETRPFDCSFVRRLGKVMSAADTRCTGRNERNGSKELLMHIAFIVLDVAMSRTRLFDLLLLYSMDTAIH